MNLMRYVYLGFALAAVLCWIIFADLFSFLFELVQPRWDFWILGEKFTMSTALGLAIGIIVFVVLRLSERVNTMGLEIANELHKVTWPSWKETKLATIVVIITSIIVSIILGLFDYIWLLTTNVIYGN